ncbi:MAG: IS110 family transposase [Acidimicrobiales bacterium]
MKRIRERVAGLDVHRDTVVACCQVKQPDRSIEVTKQSFATTANGLGELAAWLSDAGVDTVAMEATGVYWKPVYYCLEGLFDELWLCNAQHVKNVPGRKTDLSDAEWLADIAAHGMVRPSFVPPPEIRELRDVTRYRKTQVEARAKEIQRLEKTLQDAGIKLSSVASKVWSLSSRAMIEAMIDGERDPKVLAQMAKSRLRAKIPQLEEAFSGRFGPHHALVCRQVIEHIDFLDRSIATLTADVTERLCPFESAVTILCSIPGVSKTTAEVMIAEMGIDMTRFPTSGHLCAWAGVAPASHESAGKRHPVGTRKARPGSSVPSSKRPGGRRAPRAPTLAPSTPDSLDGGDPTRPPSQSPIPSWMFPGTCSPTVPSMTTLEHGSSSSDTIQRLRRSGSSAGSRISAFR